ncbi:hypothetical protein WMF20_18425 [Sorangium sp. So ce834]|uniref:hypothetical protein n=1 Tax=Sorangium sp. So ce834 TaxID=3133321 RepID=UPI003F5EDAA9
MKSTQHKEWRNEHPSVVNSPADDTSVTFSLDAPVADEDAADATSPAAHAAGDDRDVPSGQIDLTALSAGAAGAPPRVLDVLPIFPFGEPPASTRGPASMRGPASARPPAAPSPDAPRRVWRARSAAALLAAAAAVAALTAGISTLDAAPGPPAKAGLAAAARALEARLPRIEPTAAGTPAVEATAAATDAAAARAPASTDEPGAAAASRRAPGAAVASQRAPEDRARSSGAAAPPRDNAGPAAPSTPDHRAPADPCRGDLMCAMRRATGG